MTPGTIRTKAAAEPRGVEAGDSAHDTRKDGQCRGAPFQGQFPQGRLRGRQPAPLEAVQAHRQGERGGRKLQDAALRPQPPVQLRKAPRGTCNGRGV